MTDSKLVLTLPDSEPVQYEKNFIKSAVCELRFPTLLKYEKEPPVQLQSEIRKEYPLYEAQQSLNVSTVTMGKEQRYLFRSRKKDWLVSFKADSLALEANAYTGFSDFAKRFEWILSKSKRLLDTDFFTRVGLRYVNEIPIEDKNLDGWINPDLIVPVVKGVYGTVLHFVQEVRGHTTNGNYTFRHGSLSTEQSDQVTYSLDFDFYKEDVPFDSVLPLISDFNVQAFRFFGWATGHKIVKRMGKAEPRRNVNANASYWKTSFIL